MMPRVPLLPLLCSLKSKSKFISKSNTNTTSCLPRSMFHPTHILLLWICSTSIILFCHAGESRILTRTLNDEKKTTIPLMGFGVGNLDHRMIPSNIGDHIRVALESMNLESTDAADRTVNLLIDTAHASRNERIIADALVEMGDYLNSDKFEGYRADGPPIMLKVQLITKVWYTYLGYERTKISITESLHNLMSAVNSKYVDLNIIMLLHWPMCIPSIQWTNCEGEEEELPENVKKAGSPPHLNSEAWKDSWRALEEAYEKKHVDSIGVSNFDHEEMSQLLQIMKVKPHFYQGSFYQLLFDPYLRKQLEENEITYVAYGVADHMIRNHENKEIGEVPHAMQRFSNVGQEIAQQMNLEDTSLLVLTYAWLVQHNVVVIPKSVQHIRENSAEEIAKFPKFNDQQNTVIHQSLRALLTGEDVPVGAYAHFQNFIGSAIRVFWIHPETKEEIDANEGNAVQNGETLTIFAHPNHQFVARAISKRNGFNKIYELKVDHGGEEVFRVEPEF